MSILFRAAGMCFCGGVLMMSIMMTGCQKQDTILAKVGPVAITTTDFSTRIAHYPAEYQSQFSKPETRQQELNRMINETLLYLYAKQHKLHRQPAYHRQLHAAERQLLINMAIQSEVRDKLNITEKDLRNYYAQNSQLYDAAEERQLAQILVSTKKEATAILKSLRRGRTSFSELAMQKSIHATAQSGGVLGWFTEKSTTDPAFLNTAFRIKKVGAISGIVKTQYGYHIIKLLDKRIRPKKDFSDVRDQIQQAVSLQRQNQRMTDLLTQLKDQYPISKTDLAPATPTRTATVD